MPLDYAENGGIMISKQNFRGIKCMLNTDKLVEFITNLNEEEIDVIISSLPRLSEVLEGLQVPCPPVPSLPNQ